MTSECIVIYVNDLETQEEHVDEIRSNPSGPLPSSLGPKRKANQSMHESEVQVEDNIDIIEIQSKKNLRAILQMCGFFFL